MGKKIPIRDTNESVPMPQIQESHKPTTIPQNYQAAPTKPTNYQYTNERKPKSNQQRPTYQEPTLKPIFQQPSKPSNRVEPIM